MMFAFVPIVGNEYAVTGPSYYGYGAYKIQPRDENDVVGEGATATVDLTFNLDMSDVETSNIDEWNYAAIYELPKHIDTEFCILIHDDGFIVNPTSWREEFLEYDYIGAPWPLPNDDFSYRDIHGNIIRVGNSVSIRSKKLLDLPIKLDLEWKPFHGYYNEDGFICVNYRHKYIENGCKFADIEIAKYFSHESMIPEIQGIKPFAFHKHKGTNNIYPNYGK
jgi:hypothetical protein